MVGSSVLRTRLVVAGCLNLAIIATACASSGGGASEAYRRDLGRLLEPLLEESRLKIWNLHGWDQVRRESEYGNLYWESAWRGIEPEATGAATDAENARARILIRGRRVEDQAGSSRTDLNAPGGVYRVTFYGEFEVRGGIVGDDWRPSPVPDAVRALFDRVYDDMYLEVRTGIRARSP